MDRERRPVANYLENRAHIERDHLGIVESGSTELRTARFFLNISNRVRNSRMAVAALLVGLGGLVAIDVAADEDIPDSLELAMDASQIVISGALIGSAARPVSRMVDSALSIHDEFHLHSSFEPFNRAQSDSQQVQMDDDSNRLFELRQELASFGRDLSKNAIPKREIGYNSSSRVLDDIRTSIATDLSHEKDLPILPAGTVEAYLERGRVSDSMRKDPRFDLLDEVRENLTTKEDQEVSKKRKHSDIMDGVVLLFMEAQVLSEEYKQHIGVLQKKAAVILGDFAVGIGSMYGLVATAAMAAGDHYKGFAYFADDAASLAGIALAPAFKRLLTTQTARDIVEYSSAKFEAGKEKVFQAFRRS